MKATLDLAGQIDSEFSAMEQKLKKFQSDEVAKHQEWTKRLEQLGKTFEKLSGVWKPPLEVLIKKFGEKVKVIPTLAPSTRDVRLEFQSDVARIRLRFRATTDPDITKIILCYDLDVTPVLMQFDSHSELEMPLSAVSPEKIAAWVDERIISFVKTYVSLHENQYYLHDLMVEDPVSGTKFPKPAAGATMEHGGKTYYFVSEETRREFEKKHPKTTK